MTGIGDEKHISVGKLRELLTELPDDWLLYPKTTGDTGDPAVLRPPANSDSDYMGYIDLSEERVVLWFPHKDDEAEEPA